jgi:hypothetical protein
MKTCPCFKYSHSLSNSALLGLLPVNIGIFSSEYCAMVRQNSKQMQTVELLFRSVSYYECYSHHEIREKHVEVGRFENLLP